MKIGIQADTFDKSGYGRWGDDTYKKIKEHGFDCSYFNMSDTNSLIYTTSQTESDSLLLHEKKLAQDAGIEIDQVHGPWRWPIKDDTEEDRAERMEKMKKSIRATSILGCKNWVIHPVMPYGLTDANTDYAQETWDINLNFMRELLNTAKKYGVTICYENMPFHDFSIARPSETLKFVKAIDDENFKICFDTGHVSVFDDLSVGDEIRALGNEIRVFHVHDNICNQDLHLVPHFGVIDWDDFTKALNDIGFDGSITLETIPPRKLPDNVFEDMSKVLAKIAQNLKG